MNRLALAYVMDHLPTRVLQDPVWTRGVHDHLEASPGWWPYYVLPRWAPPVGYPDLEAAYYAAGDDDEVLPVELVLCQAADEGWLPVGRPEQVDGFPVVRWGNQLSRCEEQAIARARTLV